MPVSDTQRRALEEAACASRARAYAPYSGYRVGAAVLTSGGTIYTGANIENVAYSPTVCAERVALFKAIDAGERDFLAIAVCTENGGSPCGPCRQVMREFARDMEIYISDEAGNSRTSSLTALLPDSFGPQQLKE